MLFVHQLAGPTEPRSFEELRDEGRRAVEAGRLDDALEFFEQALARAREIDDQNLIDLAICNRSIPMIPLGRGKEAVPELRQILVRNPDAFICSLAAYNLGYALKTGKEFKKGLFYARIARDRALAAGRDDLLVGSYNLIGTCLMSDSFFAEAAKAFRRALALLKQEASKFHSALTGNLGYCLMMLDRLRDGMRLSFDAIRWSRRFEAPLYEVRPQMDLCYAYLELGRTQRARQHGLRALALAEQSGEVECLKNALFLLGDTEQAAGDLDAAYGYYSRLQRRYYPDAPQIVEQMIQVGLRQVVNLRA